jgi:hypothetical protein
VVSVITPIALIGRSYHARLVDAVARELGPIAAPSRLDGVIVGARISPRRSVSSREQAAAHLAVGGQPGQSQAEQNSCDTDAMMPTVAGPPSTSQSWAGAEPQAPGQRQREVTLQACQHVVGASVAREATRDRRPAASAR